MSTPFDGLTENLTWLYGGDGGEAKPFKLSAPAECYQYSEPITRFYPGDFFVFRFQVLQVHVAERFNCAIEILTRHENLYSGWVFDFISGRDEIRAGSMRLSGKYTDHTFSVSSYRAGTRNSIGLSFSHSGDRIFLELNNQLLDKSVVPLSADSRDLITRVVGLDARFFG